jgi:hypothetical protein
MPTDLGYSETETILVDPAVKARLDAIVKDAIEREAKEGESNGMTTYSGALDFVLDMAIERSGELRN